MHKRTSVAALLWLCSCDALLGLGDYSTAEPSAALPVAASSCSSHQDCGEGADYCSRKSQRCVSLKSQDCKQVSGAAYDDDAILIGSLFATSGDQASANLARERAATLALAELEAAGGLPPLAGSQRQRPLAMLSCDATDDPIRAAKHLVDELEVPAIVGPNNSQNTLDVARQVSIRGGTLTLSP